jgi:hypothetical protein
MRQLFYSKVVNFVQEVRVQPAQGLVRSLKAARTHRFVRFSFRQAEAKLGALLIDLCHTLGCSRNNRQNSCVGLL